MRISSKFHDYYDSVQSLGQDRTLVYSRKEVEETIEGVYPFPFTYINAHDYYEGVDADLYTIGFCGNIYTLISMPIKVPPDSKEMRRQYCYTLEEMDNFVRDHYRDKSVDSYHRKKDKYKQGREYWPFYLRHEALEKLFRESIEKKDKFNSYFDKGPIFVGGFEKNGRKQHKITYNCALNEFGFYRIFDSYSAFMELAMYLGNQAVPLKPLPKIDDKTMAEAKGFDKFSFRKPKRE